MQGKADAQIQGAVEKRLSKVVAPETSLDVLRMGLIRDLRVSNGEVSLTFRPSSVVCPLAFQLGVEIHNAVVSVDGVQHAVIHVENFIRAEELERLLCGSGVAEQEG